MCGSLQGPSLLHAFGLSRSGGTQDTLPVAKEQVRLGRSGLVVQYFIAPVHGSHELHSAVVMSSQAHEARCVAHITPV